MSIWSWLKRRRRLDEDDFQDEIRSHLAMAADERIADGADPRSARLASLKEFGNLAHTQEAARQVWTPWWLDVVRDLLSDVRFAVRALAKNAGFSLTVLAVLSIGIGLNAAVFTMLKSMALAPLAGVAGSNRLIEVFAETSAGRQVMLSYPDYQYLRDHDRAFSGLMGSFTTQFGLGRGRNSRAVWGEMVTGNYFNILGIGAERGRTLLTSDEIAPGKHPVVVLSDGLWRRDFGGDPDIVGKTVQINNYPLTVVGVADPSFHGTTVIYDVELFIPLLMAPQLGFTFGSQATTPAGIFFDRRARFLYPQGYLQRGATLATAIPETEALWATLQRDRPLDEPVERVRVVPFWQAPDGAPRYLLPSLTVLTAMGLLVLLIACANIAGLVLVRGISRRGELTVRLALGATRTRIVRLLIVENLVLALPGAVLGVLIAWWSIPMLVSYVEALAAPQRLFFNVDVDALVIGFAVLVGCGSALAFGFVPALHSSRLDLVSAINEDASPRGGARGRLRSGLVIAQVAVSLLLLVGAGLVTRSLDVARHTNPGFDPSHVVSIALDVRQNGYDDARGRMFYRRLLEVARADPGVEGATLAAYAPLMLIDSPSRRVSIDGYEPQRGQDLAFMSNTVSPDYFRTLRIPLLAGREFEDRDDEAGAPVAMVNATLARRFWGDAANALGKRVRAGDGGWRTIIGVAADVKYQRIDESPRPYVYLPFLQQYRSSMLLNTRGGASADVLMQRARDYVAALDGNLPVLYARSMERSATTGSLLFFNLAAKGLFLFGVVGMVLAAMGTYGLVSYTIKQSTHEIGIRMALGASGGAVVRRYLGRGLRLGGIGAAVGIVVALAFTRVLGSVLFGVSATDPLSFAQALAVVLAGVVAATIVPAWRASRTDALTALRHQ